MPSIAFLPSLGGGIRQYRVTNPGEALRRLGWDVYYVETVQDGFEADVVVFQRFLEPWLPDLIKWLRKARPHCVLVYDIDDLYDPDLLPDYNPAIQRIPPGTFDIMHEAMRAVDLITTSTPDLAEFYSTFNRTTVLRNYLDPLNWGTRLPPTPRPYVAVGWLGAFHWRGADLELLRPWVAGWMAEHPECKFISAGSGPELLNYLDVDGIVHEQNPFAKNDDLRTYVRGYDDVPRMLRDFDIGLAPMAQNRFTWKSKSAVKAMEYNAAGVPAVVSPADEYRRYIQPGVNGYFVRKNDWRTALDKALANLSALKLGARAVAEEHFIDDHVGEYVAAYESVARPSSVLLHPKLVLTPKAVST